MTASAARKRAADCYDAPRRRRPRPLSFSENEKAATSAALDPWCEARVPLMVRDQVVLQYRMSRHGVLLFEKRPAFERPGEWTESRVAKFRFVRTRGRWALLWIDSDGEWHEQDLPWTAPTFNDVLRVVDEDPTGIFWG